MAPERDKRILVVEDAEDIAASFADLLEEEGYAVACVANGREALAYLRANEPPHLILLDLMMPVMDGFQFRAEQARDPRLARIPVVVMTAGGGASETAARLGVQGVLKKPFADLEQILEMVQRLS